MRLGRGSRIEDRGSGSIGLGRESSGRMEEVECYVLIATGGIDVYLPTLLYKVAGSRPNLTTKTCLLSRL